MFSAKIGLLVVATILLISTIGKCEPPSNSYGTPLSAPISSYGTPNYSVNNINNDNHNNNNDDHGGDHGDHGDHGEPKSYEFGYQVKDDYSGNNYNRKESSDGNQVRGEYRVQLPDGRTQIVTYYADWKTGFHADVRYEGTAQYPDQYNTYNNAGVYQNNNNGYDGSSNNQYASNNNLYNGGTSSNSYNGASAGYNYNNNNNINNNNNGGGGYDSYSGNFGNNKPRPGYEYGAP